MHAGKGLPLGTRLTSVTQGIIFMLMLHSVCYIHASNVCMAFISVSALTVTVDLISTSGAGGMATISTSPSSAA